MLDFCRPFPFSVHIGSISGCAKNSYSASIVVLQVIVFFVVRTYVWCLYTASAGSRWQTSNLKEEWLSIYFHKINKNLQVRTLFIHMNSGKTSLYSNLLQCIMGHIQYKPLKSSTKMAGYTLSCEFVVEIVMHFTFAS